MPSGVALPGVPGDVVAQEWGCGVWRADGSCWWEVGRVGQGAKAAGAVSSLGVVDPGGAEGGLQAAL